MKKIAAIFILIAELFLLNPSPAVAQVAAPPIKVLILYDAPSPDPYEKLGLSYAIMLRNLIGHFDSSVDLVPIQNYTAGKLNSYQATFYLGSYYDNPIPAAFLNDVSATQNTVVWFKYNLWQMAWNPTYNFNVHYGFSFNGLKGLNAAPTSSNPTPGFFDTVAYKGKSMLKYYAYDAASGTVNADPDVGITQIIDTAKAKALVTISNSKTSEQAPYIVRAGNFWYFADLPLSYIGPRDRYLVLCDILHDIVGDNQGESHKALVRLEDVDALVSYSTVKTLTDYMLGKKIPFSIATIPHYMDPLGVYNNGIAEEVPMSQAGNLKRALNYALARGGKILMHGYTHQYDSMRNKNTGVSADDFEFWNAVQNTPVAEDSTAWALARLQAGLAEFKTNGYATPFAWEAPHYQSSPLSMRAVPLVFNTTYQRAVYYTSDTPNFTLAQGKDFAVGQFFPYVIKKDYYGQRVLPENLGNIEYDIHTIDPYSNVVYTWQDLYLNAQYAMVVRDGFASFFFHPFWLESSLNVPGYKDFQSLIQGITGLGYTWADASTLP
ncbi:DUF2334 domain-containing protein [Paraherbaspirillum soli]|uniref:DUF2334 domain-containing protein n=1 Tax=Paraherbaspirillum soli TaxID=631222 RepID=A0ABW0M5R0_9BURK